MSANTFQSTRLRWLRLMSFLGTGKCLPAPIKAATMKLPPGRVFVLREPGHIKVLRGALWLTGTPAETDMVLRTGGQLCLKQNFPYVMEALVEAEVVVTQG